MIGFLRFFPLATRLLISLFTTIGIFTHCLANNNEEGIHFEEGFKESILPFKIVDNLIIIPVNLNGLQLNFILDSGTRSILVFSNKKISNSIVDTYHKKDLSDLNKNLNGTIYYGIQLKLPGIVGEKLPIIIIDKKMRNNLTINGRIDGIIGYNLFSKFSVEVDFNKEQVILRDPLSFKPDKSFDAYPIQLHGTKPFINVNFITKDYTPDKNILMVDTGAVPALILAEELVPKTSVKGPVEGYLYLNRFPGKMVGAIKNVKSLEILGEIYPEIKSIVVKKAWFNEYLGTDRVGSIGMGFLKNHNFILDYINMKIYLKKHN